MKSRCGVWQPAWRLALLTALLSITAACAVPPGATSALEALSAEAGDAAVGTGAADLAAIKGYLLDQNARLRGQTTALKEAAGAYYALAAQADFDYTALWANTPAATAATLLEAKNAWVAASPLYEQMEGIVAGVPDLAEFDLILDAGGSGKDDPDNAAPFDLTLPDGRVLGQPGNLFGVAESALWGTEPEYAVAGVEPDLDGSGAVDFGEALPDANVLKAAADALDSYVAELDRSAQAWEPMTADAFTALVVMVPTMSEYFDSWKNSRFVMGEASTQRDFVAISRLADIQDILSSLQVVYAGLKPLVESVDATQGTQIEQGLVDLKAFVAGVYSAEQAGKRFSPEEADQLGAEAQNRATAIAGQVAQVAAMLEIAVD